MTRNNNYLSAIKNIEDDSKNVTTWHKYTLTRDNVETLAHQYLNKEINKGSLSLEGILASSSPTISDAYRFGYDTANDFDKYSDMLRNYQNRAPLILYRGASQIPYEKMLEGAKELCNPEIYFYEKGFLSCSLLPEKASKFKGIKQLAIFCPPDNNIIYMGHMNDAEEPNGCRYECVIQRGAQLELISEDSEYYYCLLRKTV